jgi:ethanolamine utilization protein EutJ
VEPHRRDDVTGAGGQDPLLDVGRLIDGAAAPAPEGALRVGVDLGTATAVLVAVDRAGRPVAAAAEPSAVVRDGLVVDYHGGVAAVRRLKAAVEGRLGRRLTHAAGGYPPGVGEGARRPVASVLEAAELEVSRLVEEPVAANAVLAVRDGAIVDIGGGTTGIAVLRGGEVVDTSDEPTGGVHVTLVIAGARRVSVEQAEALKRDPRRARELLPLVRPVFEKIGTLVRDALAAHRVEVVHLVGGTSRFAGIAGVVERVARVRVRVPSDPMVVTPLGLALVDEGGAPRA